MQTGWIISAVGHTGVLLWGLITFGATPLNSTPPESLPVDIMSIQDFSQLTKGAKTAPQTETPKPLVEKQGDPKPVDNPAPKVVDKPEVVAAADEPPKPEPPKPETKPPVPQAKPVPKPEPKPRDAFARENEPKTDPIAEAIKKDQAKKPEPKKAEPKKADPAKQQPKFEANQIQQKLALLDKREAQRRAATGDTLNSTPSLGVPTGAAATLTQSEIDALRARIQQCWSPPVGLADARDLVVVIRIQFSRDGSLSHEPMLTNRGSHALFQIAAESALRAIRRCAPYNFLPAAKYDVWKDVEITFDPRDMFRG